MSTLHVVGGIYSERAIWPDWDQVYGSAGRAAAAVSSHVQKVSVEGYASSTIADRFGTVARAFGLDFRPVGAHQSIIFSYTHGLATPAISPDRHALTRLNSITVSEPNVLRFGMLEGDAIVQAARAVYDPQDQVAPVRFDANGSRAESLAVVANQIEILKLAAKSTVEEAVAELLTSADVVVVKAGPLGAFVHDKSGVFQVPAYQSDMVWPVGSGDVFAGMFAARWASHGEPPAQAAEIAPRAVASYVESMALPSPPVEALLSTPRAPVAAVAGKVYLAAPFFSMGERWLVEEARRSLLAFGMEVFSPFHDVGPGPAETVAPADLQAVDDCDVMFAILDGLDSGTLFEVGYARHAGKPVYALAVSVPEEDLKMVEGSGCKVYSDFATALHHLTWRL